MPREQLPEIRTRRELFDYLEQQMSRSYRQLLDTGLFLSDNKFLKSFIFEFDWEPNQLDREEKEFLKDALTIPATKASRLPNAPTIRNTQEEGFFQVKWQGRGRQPLLLFLDTSSDPDRRFWLGYSVSDATELDVVIDRLTRHVSSFDRAWLWPDLLQSTQKRGEFRGIGLDYDYRRFETRAGTEDSTNYFKVQIWGGPETRQILDFIGGQEQFRGRMVLAKIRMKYWDNLSSRDKFAIEDIKYNGKFTTMGTSFGTHQSLLSDTRRIYAEKITEIEGRHTIRSAGQQPEEGVQGDPVFFDMSSHPIENLEAFCEVVFSGHMPFRLWGVPHDIPGREEGKAVSAVDLHTGSKLFFEVYHDVVCMYLYPGACGNTVARFFTNLQHTISRLIVGRDNENNPVF